MLPGVDTPTETVTGFENVDRLYTQNNSLGGSFSLRGYEYSFT